jgi:hypothetical protein
MLRMRSLMIMSRCWNGVWEYDLDEGTISVTTAFVMTFVHIICGTVLKSCLMLGFFQTPLRLLLIRSVKPLHVEYSSSSTYGLARLLSVLSAPSPLILPFLNVPRPPRVDLKLISVPSCPQPSAFSPFRRRYQQ